MKKIALLSFDLINTETNNRKLFYEYLEKNNWKRIGNLSTTWKASFKSSYNEAQIIIMTKKRVKEAANYSKIKKYNAVVHIGDSQPIEFNSNTSKLIKLIQKS